MTEQRSGALALLLIAGVFAAGVGASVALRSPSPTGPRVGDPAPDFRVAGLDGAPLSLADLRGRVVFLNFWATWCAPCREEAPSLQRIYTDLSDEGFELVAISIDPENASAEIEAFRSEFELSFPIVLDAARVAYDAYGATGVPETFLIDREGRLAERYVGPRNWDEPRYTRAIRRLLGLGEDRVSSAARPDADDARG